MSTDNNFILLMEKLLANWLTKAELERLIKLARAGATLPNVREELDRERNLKLLWRRWYDNETAHYDGLREQLNQLKAVIREME